MSRGMYLALDAGFTSDAAIERLGEEHGAGGPMTVVALLCEAKRQGRGGDVKTTLRRLASDAFLASPEEAREILGTAITTGIVETVEFDERTVHVRLPRWREWQERAGAAERQARHRKRKASNGKSRTVTPVTPDVDVEGEEDVDGENNGPVEREPRNESFVVTRAREATESNNGAASERAARAVGVRT